MFSREMANLVVLNSGCKCLVLGLGYISKIYLFSSMKQLQESQIALLSLTLSVRQIEENKCASTKCLCHLFNQFFSQSLGRSNSLNWLNKILKF